MAKAKKYYGVKVGSVPGVYETWAECQSQTKGFSGAKFQAFANKEDAQAWVDSDEKVFINNKESSLGNGEIEIAHPHAFVDGSYNPKTSTYGWGGFIQLSEKEEDKILIQGSGDDHYWAQTRNVAGEIKGSWAAIEKAKELGLVKITVYHDYLGVGFWPDGTYKAKMPGAIAYAKAVNDIRADGLEIEFVKVTAHDNIPGNELADKLAKESVGISK
ncbi:ribonuclease H1 domain-containing protein [Enterococcus sp. AZ180]|uniref:ribonuclease H1 domain-containing protein n=1 Tax=Enterococcus sp. AZ180 TaxID=2774961 RepID=UPI003F1E6AC8